MNTVHYEDILDYIAHYQDTCIVCPNYRHRECGYIFAGARLPKGSSILAETYNQMTYDERVLYDTQVSGDPCENQVTSVVFLNTVERDLELVPVGIDEDTVNILLQKAFRILHKYTSEEDLFEGTTIRSDIQKAIDLVMAHIDLDALRNGVSLYRLIQSADIGYKRENGLFTIYPREMAVSLMAWAIVQDHGGYYSSYGNFDARIWDIDKQQYIGPTWFYVEQYKANTPSDWDSTPIEHVKRKKGDAVPAESITPELQKLIDAKIIDSSLQLTPHQNRRSFVQYCHENGLYKPWLLENWRLIHNLILDQKGNPISAESFKQAFQDFQKNHL